MLAFKVADMTCEHCAGSITQAVKNVDKAARVVIDLPKHLVTVEPTEADAKQIRDVISEAGYTPVPVDIGGGDERPADRSSCGCCR